MNWIRNMWNLPERKKGLRKNELWVGFGKSVKLSEKARKQYEKLKKEGKLLDNQDTEYSIQEVLSGGLMGGYVYGYTSGLLKNITVLEGTLDIDKFQNGDYILLTAFRGEEEVPVADGLYHPGDKVTVSSVTEDSIAREITDEEGEVIDVVYDHQEEKEYEVMAIIDLPYSMNLHRYSMNDMDVVIPGKEFTKEKGENNICFAYSFSIEEEDLDAFEASVKEYTENKNPYMGYVSQRSLKEQFMGMVNAVAIIGTALAGVIAFIGILNFINAVFTGIISRKREFAMLQSIGMTARQLEGMMICEGISYVVIAGVISLCIGSLFAYAVLNALNHVIICFEYRFQILPFLIILPVLAVIAVVTPVISFRVLQRHSIVERLREAE